MDTNELMTNEDVIETTVEITESVSDRYLKAAVGVGLTVLASVIAYKYVVKPLTLKLKAKTERHKTNETVVEVRDFVEEEESEEI